MDINQHGCLGVAMFDSLPAFHLIDRSLDVLKQFNNEDCRAFPPALRSGLRLTAMNFLNFPGYFFHL
jgi:hypothetical protein